MLERRRLCVLLLVALLWAWPGGRARADNNPELLAGTVAGLSPAKVGLELGIRPRWALSPHVDVDVAVAVRGMLAESTSYSDYYDARNVHGIGVRGMLGIRYYGGETPHQGLYVRLAVGGEFQQASFDDVDLNPVDGQNPPPPQPNSFSSKGAVFEPGVGYRFAPGLWQLGVEVSVCLPTDKDPYPANLSDEWNPSNDLHISFVAAHRM